MIHFFRMPAGKTPSRETNKELRLDAIVCRASGCDFKRVVAWGTPEKPSPGQEVMASHTFEHLDHSMSWPHNVEDGMLFATEEEIRVGRAWLHGLFHGRKELGAELRAKITETLNRYGVR